MNRYMYRADGQAPVDREQDVGSSCMGGMCDMSGMSGRSNQMIFCGCYFPLEWVLGKPTPQADSVETRCNGYSREDDCWQDNCA